jgi:DME family drug/metabolite transporter
MSPRTVAYPVGVAALLGASVFWGTTGMAASFIPGVNPVAIGASTMGIGGLIMGLLALSGVRKVWSTPGTRSLVLLGAAGLALYSVVFYVGMSWAGVALGNVIALGSAPLFAGFIEWVRDKHRPSGVWLISTAITILGGVMLISGRSFTSDKAHESVQRNPEIIAAGIVLALLAGFAYALYTYEANKLMKPGKVNGVVLGHRAVVSSLQMISAVPLLIILVIFVALEPQTFTTQALIIPVMAYLVLFPTVVGHTLLGAGLGAMPASRAAVFTLFEPVVAVILAVVVVGEVLMPMGWLGLVVVLVGLGILSRENARP